jgi:ABC-2 type transport system ATP-binding protein
MTGFDRRGPTAIETVALTKRFSSVTALDDCSITVPEGRLCALVGPNGAGKTTLLRCLAGLARPTSGAARVLGRTPGQEPEFLAGVSVVGQDVPLWRRLSAQDHLEVGARLNPRWDGDVARERLRQLEVPLHRPVRTLSGGQRAQLALSLALAKQPSLLLLDEPVAALDPLARRHFLAVLAETVADGGVTVVISSHLIGDLQRVCDYLVLLAASRTQLCGTIDEIVDTHKLLSGPRCDPATLPAGLVPIDAVHTARQTTMLVRTDVPLLDPSFEVSPIGLEEIVLAYMGQAAPEALRPLHAVGGGR